MANEKQTDELYIDLLLLVRKMSLVLRRLWPAVLALTILGSGLMAFWSVRSYRPMYRSQAMFSVSVHYAGSTDLTGYSYYYDKSAAKLVSETFPHLLQAESTRALICQRLGSSFINGTISSSSLADTNLITLTVTSRDPQAAYDIIHAVMDVYPQVSRQVIGDTQLVITREPLLPTAPYNTMSWQRDAAMGAVAGMMLGLGLVVLLSLSRRSAQTPNDVKKVANLPCLASIPNVKVKRRKHSTSNSLLVTRQPSDSPFNESLRLLRLKLSRTLGPEDQVLLFTSSVPSEGKSSLAVNTALTLARHNKKVLLVDADLRGPSIKKMLNMDAPSSGLGEFLSGSGDATQFLHHEVGELYVFSGDTPLPNPTSLFQHDKLEQFISSVRPMFDYIILDTPPCTMMADAAAMCPHADKVVYVVREDFASTVQIYDGIQLLSENGAKLCGFVFNRASASHGSGYGYGYSRYGYGYGYGYGKKYGYGYGYSRKASSDEDEAQAE